MAEQPRRPLRYPLPDDDEEPGPDDPIPTKGEADEPMQPLRVVASVAAVMVCVALVAAGLAGTARLVVWIWP